MRERARSYFVNTGLLLILSTLLTSCFFPEKFNAQVKINRDKSYELTYNGTIILFPILFELKEGKKIDQEGEEKLNNFAKELQENDSGFESIKYVGSGRFHVLYRKIGILRSRASIAFGVKEKDFKSVSEIVSIKLREDGLIELTGMTFDFGNETHKMLETIKKELGIQPEGEVVVSTNATVLSHNADSAPRFFGLFGQYVFKIRSADHKPYMLLQLQ